MKVQRLVLFAHELKPIFSLILAFIMRFKTTQKWPVGSTSIFVILYFIPKLLVLVLFFSVESLYSMYSQLSHSDLLP